MTVKRLSVLILQTCAIATPRLSAGVVAEWNQKTAATQDKAEHPRLLALKGDHEGQHSIRINDKWRICFVWREGHAYEVEIVDYH